jgi:hypothetical protein
MTRRIFARSSLGLSLLLALIAAPPTEAEIENPYIHPRMR